MTITLEQPKITLPQLEREKFLKIEAARAVARAVWNAYRYGWRIAPNLATKTDGRTTEKASSPVSGSRYAEWQQITYGGRLEVLLYQTDFCEKYDLLRNEMQADFIEFADSQRYNLPSMHLLEHLFMPLSPIACKYVRLAT